MSNPQQQQQQLAAVPPPSQQQQQQLQSQQATGLTNQPAAPASLFQQGAQILRRNNPYLKGDLDTLDVLRAKLEPVGFEGYCIGMVHKRLHRAADAAFTDVNRKRRDWATAAWYLQQLIGTSFPHSTRSNPANANAYVDYDADDDNDPDFRQLPDAFGRMDIAAPPQQPRGRRQALPPTQTAPNNVR
jgi:hypothetical protein